MFFSLSSQMLYRRIGDLLQHPMPISDAVAAFIMIFINRWIDVKNLSDIRVKHSFLFLKNNDKLLENECNDREKILSR